MKKVPVREQAPDVRNKNFDEVCLGYNAEEAQEEATRCLNCKNAKCVQGCPVSINIPEFIHNVKEGNFEEAYKVIGKSSALPAVCGWRDERTVDSYPVLDLISLLCKELLNIIILILPSEQIVPYRVIAE